MKSEGIPLKPNGNTEDDFEDESPVVTNNLLQQLVSLKELNKNQPKPGCYRFIFPMFFNANKQLIYVTYSI